MKTEPRYLTISEAVDLLEGMTIGAIVNISRHVTPAKYKQKEILEELIKSLEKHV